VDFSSNCFRRGSTIEKPYTIADLPQPINHYGKSKLAGEIAVRDFCTRSFIIRSSWICGEGKTGFVNETRRQLPAGEPHPTNTRRYSAEYRRVVYGIQYSTQPKTLPTA